MQNVELFRILLFLLVWNNVWNGFSGFFGGLGLFGFSTCSRERKEKSRGFWSGLFRLFGFFRFSTDLIYIQLSEILSTR